MKRRAEAIRADPRALPKSTLGKAVRYLLNEYTALVGYLRDGRFEIDSNLVENDVRPSAVGKRRWLFIGHPDAGWRSAVIYTLIQSCRRYGINPQEYLTDVLQRLPSMTFQPGARTSASSVEGCPNHPDADSVTDLARGRDCLAAPPCILLDPYKQSSMFWSRSGAEKVLALRCIHSSRRLDLFWKHRLNQHAKRNDALSLSA